MYQRLKYPEGLGRFALEVIAGDQVYSTGFKDRLTHALLSWHGELDPNVEAAPGLEHCVVYRGGDLTRDEAFGFARSMVHVGTDWAPNIGPLIRAFTIAARQWTEDELVDAMMFAATIGAHMSPFVERLHEVDEASASTAANRLVAQPFPFRDIRLGFSLSGDDVEALRGRCSYRETIVASVICLGHVHGFAPVFDRFTSEPNRRAPLHSIEATRLAGAVHMAIESSDPKLIDQAYQIARTEDRTSMLRTLLNRQGALALELADGDQSVRVQDTIRELLGEAAA